MFNCTQRLAPNNAGWQRPTLGRLNSPDFTGYPRENGFGHEDWNFNHALAIDGFLYGYLYYHPKQSSWQERFNFAFLDFNGSSCRLIGFYLNAEFVPEGSPKNDAVLRQKVMDLRELANKDQLGGKWLRKNAAELTGLLNGERRELRWRVRPEDAILLQTPLPIPDEKVFAKAKSNHYFTRPTFVEQGVFDRLCSLSGLTMPYDGKQDNVSTANTDRGSGITPSARKWTRDELLAALNLYHQLTFGQLHARQPVIVELAKKLGRGPNSVAMKLCNFASLDPALKLRGIKGLAGASALDFNVWNEFHENPDEAVPESEDTLRKLFDVDEASELEVLPNEGIRVRKEPPIGPTEAIGSVKLRRGQEYFRNVVLNNFGGRCGVTQLAMRELLIASHILPWGTHPAERLNVRNGLCLSRLHDAAFDRWLIAFDDKLQLQLSPRIKTELSQRAIAENFGAYIGQPLHLPTDAVLPDLAFLAEHHTIFSKKLC